MGDENLIYVAAYEEFYDRIDEQHKATGHGGRDKILYNLKRKYNIPRMAVEIYGQLCKTCNLKKTQKHAGLVIKPIISKDFNVRGQVDLIDLQSCADGSYKWLLNYQDHSTKFLYLRPLQTKRAAEVAIELLKIFLLQGAPVILQSDNGREFTAEVIKELVLLWPQCKIVHGRPRHPQSQGSVERSNQDVEQMLRIWMEENKSTRWSVGCYFVQWQKNTSLHRIIGRSPYKSLYGADPKVGLESTNLPSDLIDKIRTEEDLKSTNTDRNYDSEDVLPDNVFNDPMEEDVNFLADNHNQADGLYQEIDTFTEEMLDEIPVMMLENSTVENTTPNLEGTISNPTVACCVCGNESIGTLSCLLCKKIVHDICSVISNDANGNSSNHVTCNLCVSEENIKINRKKSYDGQVKAAEVMTKRSKSIFDELEEGTYVTVAVPKFDRGPLDRKNLEGIILDKKNGVYRIGTKTGALKNWFTRSELTPISAINFNINETPQDRFISLREACTEQSMFSGQGFAKCHCQPSKRQCNTNRCACFKTKHLCTSKCHSSNSCQNK